MKIHYMLKALMLLMLAFAFWCFGESFLVTPAQEKRKSLNQLRQETVELLATLVQQESKTIELNAQLQQELYRQIEDIAQGEKKSFFSTASRQQLSAHLQKLRERKEQYDKELAELKKFVTSIKTPQSAA